MNINSVKLVYFSPTGTSKRIAEAIAKGIEAPSDYLDLTPHAARNQKFEKLNDDLTIIAVPVYAGRVPIEASHRLQRLKANGSLAALIVVYGNRDYDDALLELHDLTSEAGFKPIAGGAFIGEHSFSTAEKPTAHGRPDEKDLERAKEFGKKIREKISGISGTENITFVEVPGNRPYRDHWEPEKPMAPITEEDLCTKCGQCAEMCPVAAITLGTEVATQEDACILCCACVKNCTTNARVMRPQMQQIAEWLNTNFSERKEPETYL